MTIDCKILYEIFYYSISTFTVYNINVSLLGIYGFCEMVRA